MVLSSVMFGLYASLMLVSVQKRILAVKRRSIYQIAYTTEPKNKRVPPIQDAQMTSLKVLVLVAMEQEKHPTVSKR